MKRPSATIEKALELRKRVKKGKPNFVRQESWRYKRLSESWRRPRGLDNKMRRKIKGWPPTVSVGYRGPKVVRGLHPSGYEELLVYNAEDLKQIDPKTHAARIAHTVGKRKRASIIVEARKRKIKILNFKETREVAEEKKEELEEEVEREDTLETEKPEEVAEETRRNKPKPKRKRSASREKQ